MTFSDCPYCVDGNMPAGIHNILGPVFVPCVVCGRACPTCTGDGIFPADFDCLDCFRACLTAIGLTPVHCTACLGVLDLLPTPRRPEVTPHEHLN